ncbi:uncharacterized protein LOC110862880 isoform X2 [Folsomia candida]|uniref:uncharacterized protein LOC110862880 isoform X2 n=1 Tax=Folsomia candida TaxID=158441 RepID=UPI0016054F42|nr:uncharacterized protein LOC110862880 isoform X2 [Folsomia candida]
MKMTPLARKIVLLSSRNSTENLPTVKSEYPQAVNGDDVKMVYFMNGGHPMEVSCQKFYTFEYDLTKIWNSLVSPIRSKELFDPISEMLENELCNSIAIVGMACRYPGANNIDEFWSLLENGIDGIVRVPEWRWTKDSAFIMMDGVRQTEAGFLSCPLDMFDAKFFNTNQADLRYLDPQQRIALKVVWEALEDACIDPSTLKNTITGVFGGWWRNDFKEILQPGGIAGVSDFLKKFLPSVRGLLANIYDESASRIQQIDGEQFWIEYDSAIGIEARENILRKYVKQIIRVTLQMNENEQIDDHANFQDLGMDSLMMVEMKNGLQSSVGKRVKISINSVKDCKTVAELSARLVDLISGNESIPNLTRSELKELVIQDAQLPDTIQVGYDIVSTLCPINDISTVLITGVTGTLGPYILRELRYKYPYIKKVYCLLRPNSLLSTDDRFRRCMQAKNILSIEDLEGWVETITGDVGKELIGMNSTTYSKISSEVDAVLNLAVNVTLPERYSNTKNPHSSRIINVQGFKNILEFAVANKLKYVYQVSSIGAEQELGEDEI